MMEITDKLKERFVRDFRIPLKLFREPYFTERLALYDKQFGTLEKWNSFLEALKPYASDEEYFAEYNRIKDEAINFIKGTEAYQRFNELDMNQFAISPEHRNLSSKDVYHYANIGRLYVSIDMRKANFNTLRYFDASMFDGAETWEDFLKKFTDNENIINSKYIREVILGNCNPKRHITYEKYLMDQILTNLEKEGLDINDVVFFSNDEIVIDITEGSTFTDFELFDCIQRVEMKTPVPLRVESFAVIGILNVKTNETIGYMRAMSDQTVDFKCLNNLTYPYVLRALNGEEVQDSDLVFEHEGSLAKYIKKPDIAFTDELGIITMEEIFERGEEF